MKPISQAPIKFIYAITFLIIIPAGLWLWAKYTQYLIPFTTIESQTAGLIMIISGGSLILWAMIALKKYGRGLPMNAFPPPLFVTNGPYRIFRHPIYWGFGMLMIGLFIFTGSASGLWLVSP